MMTNSFGKRNFMQPMGRPKHALKVPCFFSFSVGGGGRFFIKKYLVPNVFPNMFFIVPHFYPICFGKCCPLFTYIGGPKGRNSMLQSRSFYFGQPPQFRFFKKVLGQSNWLVARGKKKTWEAFHLINRRGVYLPDRVRLLMLRPPAVQYQLGLPTLQGTPAQSAREVLIRCQCTPGANVPAFINILTSMFQHLLVTWGQTTSPKCSKLAPSFLGLTDSQCKAGLNNEIWCLIKKVLKVFSQVGQVVICWFHLARLNQYSLENHSLDANHDSVVDEPQLS